jgi:hypothetical protein
VGDGKSNSLFYILLTVQFDCQYSIFFCVFKSECHEDKGID